MLTPTELEKAKTFWDWFAKNRFGFEFMSEIKDPAQRAKLVDACTEEMEKYCKGMNPVIGPEMTERGGLRLVVSAAGVSKYFQQAKDLAAQAPEFPGWTIEGLVPPIAKGTQLKFQVAGIELDPDKLGVALANISGYPNHLAVLVGLRQYDADQPELMEDLKDPIVQLMSNICGEEMVGSQIQFMELRPLPDDPGAAGYHKMYNLPDMIKQYREECPTPMQTS